MGMRRAEAPNGSLNRRELLKAVGTAALVSMFPSASSALGGSRSENAGQRIRENFDVGWRF